MDKLPSVSTSSLIGVAIACSGNVLISLALTLQKLAHRRQEEEHHRALTPVSTPSSTSDTPLSSHLGLSGLPLASGNESLVPVVVIRDEGDSTHSQPGGLQLLSPRTLPKGVEHLGDGGLQEPSADPSLVRVMNLRGVVPNGDVAHSEQDRSRDHTEDPDEGVEEGAYLKSKLWWLGMLLITIGEGGNFLSYGFAPASVVAPLGTVALIANCVFAPLILREKFHPRELIGMGLAILGAVTVVYASNGTNPRLDPGQLIIAIRQIIFIVYTCITVLLVGIFMLLSRSPRWGGRYIFIDVGVCALFGGYTVLSTKALSSLLSVMFLAAFEEWVTWMLFFVLIGTSIMQIKYLNKALMRFQSKEVIPVQFVFFSLAAIVGSAVLYQEFRGLPFSRFVNFAFGIGTVFFGVYLLTSFSQDGAPEVHPNPSASSPKRNSLRLPPFSEHTPLLIPRSPLLSPDRHPAISTSFNRLRLSKRNSTGDFAGTLGIGSQGGFLLMATTPPSTAYIGTLRRSRSISKPGLGGQPSGPISNTGRGNHDDDTQGTSPTSLRTG